MNVEKKAIIPVKSCLIKTLPISFLDRMKALCQENSGKASPLQLSANLAPSTILPPLNVSALTTIYWTMWKGKVALTVGFEDSPSITLRKRILMHMNAWSQYANIKFTFSSVDPQVRISRTAGEGYWSYLGTNILRVNKNEPTLNLDSFTMATPDSEFRRVVRHEAGHTLGFPHEHLRKEIVDRIRHAEAKTYFNKTNGWSPMEVKQQVLTPLANSSLITTLKPDSKSIMCYWLPAEIMKDRKAVTGGNDISKTDGKFAGYLYPKKSRR
jgi:hypothetical protein